MNEVLKIVDALLSQLKEKHIKNFPENYINRKDSNQNRLKSINKSITCIHKTNYPIQNLRNNIRYQHQTQSETNTIKKNRDS